ncbi:MAG: putative rane protein [Chloroflexi bacterium]|nr:putative rane protein [Chloroflexota bacterium]
MIAPTPKNSPKWSSNTKLIVGFTLVAFIAILVVQFRTFIGPLILSFVLAVLLQPLAALLNTKLKIPWRLSVGIVFFVLIIVAAGIFTLAGFAIVQQLQSLIQTIERFFSTLPQLVVNLATRAYTLGPFTLDLARFDLTSITNQILSSAQSVLGQVGGLVSTIATGTINTIGRAAFILIIAYFLMSEGGQVRENILKVDVPGYEEEIRQLIQSLTRIWDVYLRSQILIILFDIVAYYLLMTILGMPFSFGLALMAGLARLVPYLGPFIVWTTAALVAYFSAGNYFGLQPWAYMILVLGLAWLLDQIFDQYVQPRFMGRSLRIHPAAILIAAIIAFQWLGIIGLVLAAPVLATVTLFFRYALRKLFDLDPWPKEEQILRQPLPINRLIQRLRTWWRHRNRG